MNVIAALEALSNKNRLKILHLLRKGPHSTRRIAQVIGTSRPAVSQHLHVLRQAGLVDYQVDGRKPQYFIAPKGFADVRRYLQSFEELRR